MERSTLKPPEAANYLGISLWKLYMEAKKGGIPHFRVGNRLLFRKQTLDDYVTQLEAESISKQRKNSSDV